MSLSCLLVDYLRSSRNDTHISSDVRSANVPSAQPTQGEVLRTLPCSDRLDTPSLGTESALTSHQLFPADF